MGKLLGDRITELTVKKGIQPCGACKERQDKLNAMHQNFLDKLTSLRAKYFSQ